MWLSHFDDILSCIGGVLVCCSSSEPYVPLGIRGSHDILLLRGFFKTDINLHSLDIIREKIVQIFLSPF